MADQPERQKAELTPPRILVVGVGGSGVCAITALSALDASLPTVSVDTDKQVLDRISGERIHIGERVTNGFSAGGDVELGRQSVEKDSARIRSLLRQVDLLVVVTGLGGGTGSGAVPVITRLAREAGTLVLCLASMPFAFEGKRVVQAAEEALKRIRTHADAIVRIPNERLVGRSDADLPAETAFFRSHAVMAESVIALWRLLNSSGISRLDFASIHTLLRNCDGFCHCAVAEAVGERRAVAVGDQLMNHPLLNKGRVLAQSAGIVVGLSGGADLRLSEIEAVMKRLQDKLPEEAWINMGVAADDPAEGRMSAVVLVAEQWREPLMDDAGRQMGLRFNRRSAAEQGELPLEATGKGRFAKLDPTVHDNQDLDMPTFSRRGLKLPR